MVWNGGTTFAVSVRISLHRLVHPAEDLSFSTTLGRQDRGLLADF